MLPKGSVSASSTTTIEPLPNGMNVKKDARFWAIVCTLGIMSFLASIENTIVVIALPTIVGKLNAGPNYVWINNIFFLTSTAFQPIFGQLSDLFGRRYITLFVVALYTLGCGICGGADSAGMLIVGRGIQGAGSGGINTMVEVIGSDLVPLRQRGIVTAVVLTIYGVGTGVGPYLGGVIVERTTWRWAFYMNLPVGALAMVLLFVFLRVEWNRTESVWTKLKQIDYLGISTVTTATTSVLIALTWAGRTYPWSSPRVIIPLTIGMAGLVFFVYLESLPFITHPVIPPRLFKTRTAIVVSITTFIVSALAFWTIFFIPLYFQAVRLSTPSQSGVELLVLSLVVAPGAAVSAFLLSRYGRYKPLHIIGFVLYTLGLGLYGVLDKDTKTGLWIFMFIIPGLGCGMLVSTLLPAFQAAIPEQDQAVATASWNFQRSFGNVWGVAIAAAIFDSYTFQYSESIADPTIRALLSEGDSYGRATKAFVESFEGFARQQVQEVFTLALRKVFLVAMSFSALGLVVTFFEKEIPLRTELKTDFGLEKRTTKEEVANNTP